MFVAGRLASLCQSGECDAMARDLLPLVSAQRAAIARSRAQIEDLDLQVGGVEADLCLEKGGEEDELLRLRLRPELSVSAGDRLPVLTRP